MSIYVKQGDKLKEFYLNAPVDWRIGSEQVIWCRKNFAKGAWAYHQHQGVIYFEHEKDLAWFKLRWA